MNKLHFHIMDVDNPKKDVFKSEREISHLFIYNQLKFHSG